MSIEIRAARVDDIDNLARIYVDAWNAGNLGGTPSRTFEERQEKWRE